MPSEDVIKAFKKFDKDGNGVISRSELSMVSRQMKQRTWCGKSVTCWRADIHVDILKACFKLFILSECIYCFSGGSGHNVEIWWFRGIRIGHICHWSAQIIATSPDVTVKLDLTCWNKVFHVYPKLRIPTTITGPTIRLVYPSTQYCSTHSYEIKGLRIYNTSNQELQQSSLVPRSSILRLHGSTPSQTNCPAAAGCWKAFYQSFPARPGSLCRQARGESRLPRGESSPGISNDVVFGIFGGWKCQKRRR